MSKLNLCTALRNVGFQGKLGAHIMCWFGEPSTGDPSKTHRVTRYNSSDPLVVAAQLANMQAVGIDFVISTWMGLVSPFVHETSQEIAQQCSERGMGFVLLMDPWICKMAPNKEVAVAASLKDPGTQAMLNGKSYLPEKFVLDFATGVNLATMATQFPTLKFLAEHSGFAWPDIPNTVQNLAQQHSNPAMQIPCVCPQFSDGGRLTPSKGSGLDGAGRNYEHSIWSDTDARRVIDHQAGNFYHDTVATLPLAKNAKYAAVVTWNDHDEGTCIEPFISMVTGIRIGK